MVPVVSFVGSSGSGKTTLVEKVVSELKRRGYTVGVIKHDAHGFDIDREGKDSWRHKRAGASTVALSSPEKFAVIKDVETEWGPERIIDAYLSDADVVVTEGFKKASFPKIEVVREANSPKPVCAKDKTLMAFATDVKLKTDLPVFGLNDFRKITTFIERKIIKGGQKGRGVLLIADGKRVTLKPFIENLIRDAVTGMVRSLKDCDGAREIEIKIKP